MGKWGELLIVVCGLSLAACGGNGARSDVFEARGDWDVADGLGDVWRSDGTSMEVLADGCGGSCDEWLDVGSCGEELACDTDCQPDCLGKECGDDGCGGSCGECEADSICGAVLDGGQMLHLCLPTCAVWCAQQGLECGIHEAVGPPDVSDGTCVCGQCPCETCSPEEVECAQGQCVEPECCDCACVLDCIDACPADDQACFQECINSGPAVPDYNEMVMCLDQAGYFDCAEDDQDCLNETFDMCFYLYYECYHGDLECVEMYLCLFGCPEGDAGAACAQKCFAQGTVDALQTWDAFIDCLDENGYFDCDDDDENCYDTSWEPCDGKFRECAHGELSCAEVLACVDVCEQSDDLCVTSCHVHGSLSEQALFEALQNCVESECGEKPDADCLAGATAGACAGEQAACLD